MGPTSNKSAIAPTAGDERSETDVQNTQTRGWNRAKTM